MSKAALCAEGFASVKEAASFLALSRYSVYRLVQGGALSSAVIAGKICIPKVALRKYAERSVEIGAVA